MNCELSSNICLPICFWPFGNSFYSYIFFGQNYYSGHLAKNKYKIITGRACIQHVRIDFSVNQA